VRYVLGNATALLIGLVAAYLALTRGTDVSIKIHDFMEYYSASHLVVTGHGGNLYNFPVLGQVQSSLAYPLWPGKSVLPFLYPPYVAVALAPLAALPYEAAFLAWLALNCVLFFSVCFSLERYAGLTGRCALLLRLGAVCSLPVFMALGLGQVSILLLALFTLAFFALRAGRDGIAGVALALALVKPAYVVPFLLVLLVRRRWRALAAFGLSTVVLALAAVPFCGLSVNVTYVRTLLTVGSWQGHSGGVAVRDVVIAPATYAAQWNHSFAGFVQLLLPSRAALVGFVGFAGIALVYLARFARRDPDIEIPLGLAAIVALLISPHTLAYDLTILLLPVGVTLRYRRGGSVGLKTLLIATYVLILVGYRLSFVVPLQLSVLVMLALAAWICFATGSQAPKLVRNQRGWNSTVGADVGVPSGSRPLSAPRGPCREGRGGPRPLRQSPLGTNPPEDAPVDRNRIQETSS
jgi:hypothetical protein